MTLPNRRHPRAGSGQRRRVAVARERERHDCGQRSAAARRASQRRSTLLIRLRRQAARSRRRARPSRAASCSSARLLGHRRDRRERAAGVRDRLGTT